MTLEMAERVNVKAKCLRYRGFFQWFILGLIIIVIVHFSVRDMYPSWLRFNVEKLEEKTMQKPSVVGNAQKPSVGQQSQQIQLQQQYQQQQQQYPQQQYTQQQGQQQPQQTEKQPQLSLKKPDEPVAQTGERQRAQEVDNTVQQKPEQNQQENAQQSVPQAVGDQQQQQQQMQQQPLHQQQQQPQQQLETKQVLFNQQQQQQGQLQQQQPQQQLETKQGLFNQQPRQGQPQQGQQQPEQQQPQQQIETKQGSFNQQNGPAMYPFLDVTKSWEERVDDLVSRLNINQVVSQTQAFREEPTPPIENLGVRPFVWRGHCLFGWHGTPGTAYPQAVGLAATFCPDLVHNVSLTISYEARAHWNRNLERGDFRTMEGLTCFSPTINIFRHPMWGRNQETYGEDPYLTSQMARAFVMGLQGQHERYIRVGAACKHFAAHSGPEHDPISRLKFDAAVQERDMRMTYLPAFKACVDAKAVGIMCSYNKINGVPACANKDLLTGVLRDLWQFKGFVVSDAGAIDYMRTEHNYRETKWDTVVAALTAGVNLELSTKSHAINQNLLIALEKKIITEQQIRDSIKPLFMTRMKLGEFDPPEMNPYTKVNMSIVQRERHRNLASRVASASFVLLKNMNNTLPIQSQGNNKVILVLGPVADSAKLMYGEYGPHVHPKYAQKPLLGLQGLSNNVKYESACADVDCSAYDAEKVKRVVGEADLIIFTMIGVTESEFRDRTDFLPPGKYMELIQKLPEWTKAPTVLLLFSGAPVQLQWAQESKHVTAIMQCFLPGQSAGDAIFNSLTAKTPSDVPAGRLPFTWPKALDKLPGITDYRMEGRTYRYSNEEPLYPFGYGLSYTRFQYESVNIEPKTVDPKKNFSVTVVVKNVGLLAADEVVQLYVSWPEATIPSLPKRQLVAFKRLQILPSRSETVNFAVPGLQLMVWVDKNTGFKVLPGKMKLYAGGQQPNQQMSVGSNILETEFTVNQS